MWVNETIPYGGNRTSEKEYIYETDSYRPVASQISPAHTARYLLKEKVQVKYTIIQGETGWYAGQREPIPISLRAMSRII